MRQNLRTLEQRSVLPDRETGGRGSGELNLETLLRVFAAPAAPALPGEVAPVGLRGDHTLNADLFPAAPLVPAAVLVPIVDREEGPTVLFTLRTPHLIHHAGQISFPGGRVEPGDASPEAAALRETEEEVGLAGDRIEVIGRLEDYVTRSGFRITPVVAIVKPPFALAPDPFEVAEVFEVPLAFLLDPANHLRHTRMIADRERAYYAMPYGNRYIWGATAGMLKSLYELVRGAA